MAAEILARPGRDIIKKFYMDNPTFIKDHPGTVMRCLTYASEKGDVMEGVPQPQGITQPYHVLTAQQQSHLSSATAGTMPQN